MEDVTYPEFAGVPKGVLCIAEDSYSPSGLMQGLCNKIDSMNTSIAEKYPGQYDDNPLTIQDVGLKMKIVPKVPRSRPIIVVIKTNPDYSPNNPDSFTHYIAGDGNTPIFLDCSKNEDGTFVHADKIETSYKELMSIFRERITRWYRNRSRNLPMATGFDFYTQYIGRIDLEGERKSVVSRGIANGVMISRPFTKQEAPSLFPESN